MNRVSERCKKDSCAKFYYTAKRMFAELKYIKLFLYFLNVVPVVICFLPTSDETTKLICSCISFGFTLINLVGGALLSNYKEKAIMEHQLYEANITGSSFSKIEYDRESTNDLQELAIRKGLPKLKKGKTLHVSYVPQDVTDDYSYLFLCRTSAAKIKYLLSRLFYGYVVLLVGIAVALFAINFDDNSAYTIYTLVCCWSLITPLISNSIACKKCIRLCSKICADIDNYFADGDLSVERLARFYYYVQNMEFEMLLSRPIIFTFMEKLFRRGLNVLSDGVTQRFKEAIFELKKRNYVMKGVISQPHGKGLITTKDYDLEYLAKKAQKKKEEQAKQKAALKSVAAGAAPAPQAAAEPEKQEAKPAPAPAKQEAKSAPAPAKQEAKPAPAPAKQEAKPVRREEPKPVKAEQKKEEVKKEVKKEEVKPSKKEEPKKEVKREEPKKPAPAPAKAEQKREVKREEKPSKKEEAKPAKKEEVKKEEAKPVKKEEVKKEAKKEEPKKTEKPKK